MGWEYGASRSGKTVGISMEISLPRESSKILLARKSPVMSTALYFMLVQSKLLKYLRRYRTPKIKTRTDTETIRTARHYSTQWVSGRPANNDDRTGRVP